MAEYLTALTSLCEDLGKRGSASRPTTERAFYAHCLLLKVGLHARSITTLSTPGKPGSALIDVSGICILARCLVESRNVVSYLLERNISKEEAHLRLHLLALNHSVDALRIDKNLQTREHNMWVSHTIELSREQLMKNSIFDALDPAHKKNLLRGKSPFQFSRYRGQKPISASQESGIYTLLSQSAHSFSLGLTGFAGFGEAAPTGRANSYHIALLTAQIYLADILKNYCNFRRKAIGPLLLDHALLIEAASNPAPLNQVFSRVCDGTAP